MQSFGDLFANNRLLALGLLLAAVAVILAVGIGLFRLMFGRRLHMAGGRTRQPRLGVVDAFDLDRQRQLVIVRRDNVEHLLMIGGPNDVLIEAAIIRAPASLNVRDKENGAGPSIGIAAPIVAPAAGTGQGSTLPPQAPNGNGEGLPIAASVAMPPEPPSVAVERDRSPVVADPAPAAPPAPPEPRLPSAAPLGRSLPQRTPPTPMPQRPPVTPVQRPAAAPTPRPNLSRATPVAPPPATTGGSTAGRIEPSLNRTSNDAPVPEAGREEPTPGPAIPTIEARGDERGPGLAASALPPRPAQAGPATLPPRQPVPPRPVTSTPRPPQPTRPPTPQPAATRSSVPSLGSLEEEMAKLLGRPVPPSDQSGGH